MNFGTHIPPLDRAKLAQKHAAILGMTGSGKTNTAYVWIEEELERGGLVTILDPEGDYHLLRNEYPLLICGRGRKGNAVDLPIAPSQAAQLGTLIGAKCLSAILDLSGYVLADRDAFVLGYLSALWQLYQDQDLPPMRIVVDEVQLFAPQGPATASKALLQDIAARGRKRNFVMLMATQRPQKVDKDLLDAADLRIIHKVMRGRALDAIVDLLPDLAPDDGKAKDRVPGLSIGQAIWALGNTGTLCTIRESRTFRPHLTPLTEGDRPVSQLDVDLIAALQRTLSESATTAEPLSPSSGIDAVTRDYVAALEAEIATKAREIAALAARVAELEATLALLPATPAAAGSTTASRPFDEESPYRSPMQIKRATSLQIARFSSLLARVSRERRYNLRLAALLIQNEGRQYGIKEAARWLGIAEKSLRSTPPTLLMTEGLIKREIRNPKTHLYWSEWSKTATAKFPDLDFDDITGRLIAAMEG